MYDFIFQVASFEGLPVMLVTNYEQSRIDDELQQIPSFMKHLQTNYPNGTYLQNILHGLMEAFPEIPCDLLMENINQWPGIAGKLSLNTIENVKESATKKQRETNFLQRVQNPKSPVMRETKKLLQKQKSQVKCSLK